MSKQITATENLINQINSTIATRFNIPELRTATPDLRVPHKPVTVTSTSFTTVGQGALVWREANVTVRVFDSYDDGFDKGFNLVRVELRYFHHDGGSNGVTRDMIAVQDDDRGLAELVDRDTYQRIRTAAYKAGYTERNS